LIVLWCLLLPLIFWKIGKYALRYGVNDVVNNVVRYVVKNVVNIVKVACHLFGYLRLTKPIFVLSGEVVKCVVTAVSRASEETLAEDTSGSSEIRFRR
jgi:hypothetical protein